MLCNHHIKHVGLTKLKDIKRRDLALGPRKLFTELTLVDIRIIGKGLTSSEHPWTGKLADYATSSKRKSISLW